MNYGKDLALAKPDKKKFLGLLISSFVLSVFLFYYISGEESIEVDRDVVVTLVSPSGMTILGGPQREVSVTLSASRNVLAVLSATTLTAEHIIDGVEKAGEYSFALRDRDIDLPHGNIKVANIEPKVIAVTLDKVVTKKMMVKVAVVGDPASGYVVDHDSILKDPTAALLKGPKSVLEEMQYVLTEPIDVIGRIRSFRIRVPLKNSPHYSVESKNSIDVFIPLRQEGFSKTLEHVPVNVLHSASSNFVVSIKPVMVDIPLKGTEKTIAALEKKNIRAYIDITELSRGEYQLPLMLSLPSEVALDGEVPVITVTIEEKMKEIVPSISPDMQPGQEGA